ncbi:structural maintenance of chromosomes protein 5 [Vairimorpha apis BRL 01]|uniref:Structural maintenance of chromosomes protein 5 n=1 Tax=Vairimorpha apis BRL 01 TaxID=1037528 RepID=T0L845_9MICR|nr:structural maintenance of chromosomes protein 5 [Vairimorpha apis BRL 01]
MMIFDIENQINVIENNPFNLELQECLKELNSLDNQINEFLNKFKFNLNEIELLEIENELVNKKKVDRENEVCKLRNEVSDYRREVENIKSKICCDREYFNDDVFEGGGMYKRSDGRMDKRMDILDGNRNDILESRIIDGNRMDKRNERMDTLDNNRMYNTNDNNISIDDNTNIDNTLNLDFIYQTSNIDNLFIQYDNTALDELQDELFRNKKSTDQIKQTCFDIKRQVDILEEEKRKIMEYKERRMEQLKRYSYDTYRAVMWLRENREKSVCDGKSDKDSNNIDSKDSNIDSNCNIKDSKDIKDIHVDNDINIKDNNIISKDIKDTKNTLKDTKNINDIKDNKNIKDINKSNYIKFKDEIIEPPFLNINIKNENYINEVEIFLNYHVLTSFICKNSEDFELFSKIMKDEKSLSINVVEAIRKVPSPSHTPEEIKSYGFDGVILDYIDARNEIKDLLCVSCHVHDVPVLRSGGDVNRLDGGSKNRLDGDNVNRLDGGSKNGNVNRLDVDNVNRLDGGNDGEEKFKRMAISNNRDKKYINSSGMDNNNIME